MENRILSIWLFVGIILSIYGVLIFGAGIYGFFFPPAQQVVHADLHAGIWWGILLMIMGAMYCIKFLPKKSAPKDNC
jgi:hypothetical protein